MSIAKDATDSELRGIFERNTQLVKNICMNSAAEEVEIHLTISGYESDPRDLYEIPAAKGLRKKLIDMGLYGLLMLPAAKYGKKSIMQNFTPFGTMQAYFPCIAAYTEDGLMTHEGMLQNVEHVRRSCCVYNCNFDRD